MDWSGEWWIGVLGVGLALLIGAILYAKRKRAAAFRSAAEQLGFIAFKGPSPFSKDEKKRLNLFSRGNGRKLANIIADRPDSPSTLVFDFHYRFGLPLIASVGYNQSVAAFSVHLTGIPDFQMTPATALDRAAPKLGLQAIRFDSHPEFGQKYWLRAPDELAVRAFFSNSFLDRLRHSDPAARWSVEKAGRWLIVYRHNVLFPLNAITESWRYAHGLANLFIEPH